MIYVYTTKAFNALAKSKLQRQMDKLDARLDAKAKRNVAVRVKMKLKAKNQARCKDGRFSKPLLKLSSVENNPLVTFEYPRSDAPGEIQPRLVRLISVTSTHITGLERVNDQWKYKKFLVPKTRGLRILSFNAQAMS